MSNHWLSQFVCTYETIPTNLPWTHRKPALYQQRLVVLVAHQRAVAVVVWVHALVLLVLLALLLLVPLLVVALVLVPVLLVALLLMALLLLTSLLQPVLCFALALHQAVLQLAFGSGGWPPFSDQALSEKYLPIDRLSHTP